MVLSSSTIKEDKPRTHKIRFESRSPTNWSHCQRAYRSPWVRHSESIRRANFPSQRPREREHASNMDLFMAIDVDLSSNGSTRDVWKLEAMKRLALHNICMRCSSRSTPRYSNRPRPCGLTSLRMKFSNSLDATSELQLVWEQSRLKWDTCVSSPVLLSNSTLLTWFWAENDQKDFQGNIDALLRSLILEHEKKLGRKAHERAKAEAMQMNLRRGGWSISSEVNLVMFECILHGQGNVIRVDNCHHTTPFHSCRYIINLIFDFVLHSSSVFIISTHSHLFKTTSPKTALSPKNLVSSR